MNQASPEAQTVDECRQRLAGAPNDTTLLFREAELLEHEERLDEALAAFTALDERFTKRPLGAAGALRCLMKLGRETDAVALAERALERFPQHTRIRGLYARALNDCGRATEAAEQFSEIIAADPDNLAALLGLARHEVSTGQASAAAERVRPILEQDPDHRGALQVSAQAQLALGNEDEGEHLLERLWGTDTQRLVPALQLIRRAHQAERWDRVLEFGRRIQAVNDEPEVLALIGLALDRLEPNTSETADTWSAIEAASHSDAHCAAAMGHFLFERHRDDESVPHWRRAVELEPHNRNYERGLLLALMRLSDDGAAREFIEAKDPGADDELTSASLWALFHLHRYEYDETLAMMDSILSRTDLDLETQREAELWRASSVLSMQTDLALVADAASRLRSLEPLPRHGYLVLTDLLIALGEFDEAATLIDSYEQSLAHRRRALSQRAWLAIQRGNPAEAKELGREWVRAAFTPQLDAPIDDFRGVERLAEIRDGEVLVLGAVRDEVLRIEDFLSHHRDLGIDRFVLVDNGSTDGTAELLDSQSDVILIQTTDDYVTAGFGMRWINHLVDLLTTDNWLLFLDADEFFVFPGSEGGDIRTLTGHLERNGQDAVAAFMLDMHAESYADQVKYQAGESLLDHYPYFTNSYQLWPMAMSPYTVVRGGFRESVMMVPFREQTKTPLIHSKSGIRFLLSSHLTTPCVISDVSAVLLHFKYVGDSIERAAKESSWTKHNYYSDQDRRQRDTLADGNFSYVTDDMVRYEGSSQLAELGLLRGHDRLK